MFIFFSGRCRKPKTIDITSTVGSSQRDGRCDVLHGAEDGSAGRRVDEAAVEDGVAGG